MGQHNAAAPSCTSAEAFGHPAEGALHSCSATTAGPLRKTVHIAFTLAARVTYLWECTAPRGGGGGVIIGSPKSRCTGHSSLPYRRLFFPALPFWKAINVDPQTNHRGGTPLRDMLNKLLVTCPQWGLQAFEGAVQEHSRMQRGKKTGTKRKNRIHNIDKDRKEKITTLLQQQSNHLGPPCCVSVPEQPAKRRHRLFGWIARRCDVWHTAALLRRTPSTAGSPPIRAGGRATCARSGALCRVFRLE
jgi:hypothetical protein